MWTSESQRPEVRPLAFLIVTFLIVNPFIRIFATRWQLKLLISSFVSHKFSLQEAAFSFEAIVLFRPQIFLDDREVRALVRSCGDFVSQEPPGNVRSLFNLMSSREVLLAFL